MKLSILLFASYADAFGRDQLEVSLPSGSTVSDLVRQVTDLSNGALLPPAPAVAVNHRHVRYDRVITPDDEVAIIPPVAGG